MDSGVEEVIEIINNQARDKFWGEMVLLWQDGIITSYKITSTHKPNKQADEEQPTAKRSTPYGKRL